MNRSAKRMIVVSAIIVVSILLGFAIDLLWSAVEKKSHPDEYIDYVRKYAYEYNIPESVIFAVIKVESDFDPEAESVVGARGLMQMMPSTFEWLTSEEHLGENLHKNKLFTPEVSIRYGTYYLNYLYEKFDRNWDTALAAYNAGEGNVAKWLESPAYHDKMGKLQNIPFKETRSYVRKVNLAKNFYEHTYNK